MDDDGAGVNGEVVARVLKAYGSGLAVELSHGAQGWIKRTELANEKRGKDPNDLVGERLAGLITGIHPGGRGVLVSPRKLAVQRFSRALESGRRVSGRVVRANRGGLVVVVDGFEAFVPRSELRRREREDHRAGVGKRWRGYVKLVTANTLLLSSQSPGRRRRALRRRLRFVARLHVGEEREGQVCLGGGHERFVRLHKAGVDALVLPDRWGRDAVDLRRLAAGERVRVKITAIRENAQYGEPGVRAVLVE